MSSAPRSCNYDIEFCVQFESTRKFSFVCIFLVGHFLQKTTRSKDSNQTHQLPLEIMPWRNMKGTYSSKMYQLPNTPFCWELWKLHFPRASLSLLNISILCTRRRGTFPTRIFCISRKNYQKLGRNKLSNYYIHLIIVYIVGIKILLVVDSKNSYKISFFFVTVRVKFCKIYTKSNNDW